MSENTKRRAGARGWLTRAQKALSNELRATPINKFALTDAIDEFDKRLTAVDEAQELVEREVDEKDLEAEIEEASAYRTEVRKSRIRAAEILAAFNGDVVDGRSVDNSESTFTKPEVKLPKLVLPTFSGNVVEWHSFWDQFVAVVDESELPDITKFTYLRSLLKEEALEAIQGLSLTAKQYAVACKILNDRFGKPEKIIFKHVQELLSMSALGKQSSLTFLRKLQDKVLSHVRSLEALGITGKQYGVLLTPIVLSCLPADIRMEWARCSEEKESDLEWLLTFLDKEISLRDKSQTFKTLIKSEIKTEERKKGKPTATALHTTSKEVSGVVCAVCKRAGHSTAKCWNLTKVPLEERKEQVQKSGLCFRCLEKGHLAQSCTQKCSKCQGQHHFLFCKKFSVTDGNGKPSETEGDGKAKGNPEKGPGVSLHSGTSPSGEKVENVVLQTALVEVSSRTGPVKARLLFDTGADRTYVSSKFVKSTSPEYVCSEPVSYGAFGTKQVSESEMRNVYKFNVRSGLELVTVVATEIPVVCAPLHRRKVPAEVLQSVREIKLADDYDVSGSSEIDILVGLDCYWQLVKPNVVSVSEGLVAQETRFGWILSGVVKGSSRATFSHQLLCLCDFDAP